MPCQVCRLEVQGPSDHEPWCPCFMRGPVGAEGQTDLLEQLGELERPVRVQRAPSIELCTINGTTFYGSPDCLTVPGGNQEG